MLYSIIGGTKPAYSIQADEAYSLSPDGNWLIYRQEGRRLLNLATQTETPLEVKADVFSWLWAPNSLMAVAEGFNPIIPESFALHLINTAGETTITELPNSHYHFMGWYDNSTLWVRETKFLTGSIGFGEAQLLNVKTGKVSAHQMPLKAEDVVLFYPGLNGAWVTTDGDSTTLCWENRVYVCDRKKSFASWVPDGSGAILAKAEELTYWQGDKSVVLPIKGSILGWKTPRRLYCFTTLTTTERYVISSPTYNRFPLSWRHLIGIQHTLFTYGLDDGIVRDEKIYGCITAAAGNTVLVDVYGFLRVYLLP